MRRSLKIMADIADRLLEKDGPKPDDLAMIIFSVCRGSVKV